MNSQPARITIEWPAGERLELDDLEQADAVLLERRSPATVTLDNVQLHVVSLDLANPEFSLLDVPFVREVSP